MIDFANTQTTNTKSTGRLAPSPTGAQHLGNARTFLLAWLYTRNRQGKLLLRIEDLDSPRIKKWATKQAIEDLRWLGLDWDIGPDHGTEFPQMIQSLRVDRYLQVLEELKARELVYPCTCTRSDVERAGSAPHESQMDGVIYPGTCKKRNAQFAQKLVNDSASFSWRFRMPDKNVTWVDKFMGERTMNPATDLGDFVIAKSNGLPSYQLAAVVDDHDMGVTEVVRGDDLSPSTIRQLCIYESLEWSPPDMVHVPLVIGQDGRRLAKRHGDSRLSTMREKGVHAETIIGYLAWSCGLIEAFEPKKPSDLLGSDPLARLPHSPFTFLYEDAVEFFVKLQATC
jgi:glutamyl-tRNA synthetase